MYSVQCTTSRKKSRNGCKKCEALSIGHNVEEKRIVDELSGGGGGGETQQKSPPAMKLDYVESVECFWSSSLLTFPLESERKIDR